jgi:glycosyltransferase involved in cell wall biosynthesis
LTDSKPHGDGLVAYEFITHLAERGHSLHVAAEQVDLASPVHANIKIYQLASRPFRGGIDRLRYMVKMRSLFHNLGKSIQFDLIHQLNPVYTGMSLALHGSACPIVLGPYVGDWPQDAGGFTESSSVFRGVLSSLKRIVSYLQQRDAGALLLTTDAARGRIVDPRGRRKTLHTLPHGVDTCLFSPGDPAADKQRPEQPTVVLFYANISARKGIYELLSAFDSLGDRFPDSQLWIAGGGEELQAAKAMASTLGSCNRISFLGKQTRQQAAELLRKADICCLPSHGEPFGMTALEAMSSGLPMVVTDDGGLRWLVDDAGGIRVPVRKPERLADALSQLISDAGRRRAMGRHNRMRAVNEFDWNRVVSQLESIYYSTLSAARQTEAVEDLQALPLVKELSDGGEPL